MKKFFICLLAAACIGLASASAYAAVGHQETITVGTSTGASLGQGSSTTLALSQYNQTIKIRGDRYVDPGNFEAYLQYSGALADMRYTLVGTPTVTSGFTLADKKAITLRSVTDMKGFRCCAGTTTEASYGTITAMYSYSPIENTAPRIIVITGN